MSEPLSFQNSGTKNEPDFKPLFFRPAQNKDVRQRLDDLRSSPSVEICDTLRAQLAELAKIRTPSKRLSAEETEAFVKQHLGQTPPDDYGVWVYYPWSRRLVHLLDEAEFVEVRTSRNKYKITADEQRILSTKRIAVVGLSVGQSVALTLAMERGFGELRLADFDTLDLSNLNRIRSGVHELSLPKVVIAAREIFELDPFLKVSIFPDGLTDANMESLFHDGGDLDLFIEECDSLEIKIKSRIKARSCRIPVLMDTSDRGMVDIERFDLEPERPLLHGLTGGVENGGLENLRPEERMPLLMKLVSGPNLSPRMKASVLEVGQTITTWPQTASSVVQGGGIVAEISRRILLGENIASGRHYFDVDGTLKKKEEKSSVATEKKPDTDKNEAAILSIREAAHGVDTAAHASRVRLEAHQVNALLEAARLAPSLFNVQPWKWFVEDSIFYLAHDQFRPNIPLDAAHFATYLSLGAAAEALRLSGVRLGLGDCAIQWLDPEEKNSLVAIISFNTEAQAREDIVALAEAAKNRTDDARLAAPGDFPAALFQKVQIAVASGASVYRASEQPQILELSKTVGASERIMLLHRDSHRDYFPLARWSADEGEKCGDGFLAFAPHAHPASVVALKMASEAAVAKILREQELGSALSAMSAMQAASASGYLLFLPTAESLEALTGAGQAMLRAWIVLNEAGKTFQPVHAPIALLRSALYDGAALNNAETTFAKSLHQNLESIFSPEENTIPCLLVKIGERQPGEPVNIYRRALEQQAILD